MKTFCILLIGGLLSAVCDSRTLTVTSSNCGGTYTLDDDPLYLTYNGDSLGSSECRYTIELNDITDEICASPEKFDVDDCDIELEYHNGYYSSFSPDKTYGCRNTQYSSHCTVFSKLVVVFKNDGGSTSDTIKLKIYAKENDIVGTVKTTIYVTVGVIVGVIVLLIIVTIIVVCVCCRRRRSQGTVYRAQQPATVTTTTTTGYPMHNQAGYQPVQPMFGQPAPQAGYQQPPPAGYQPGYQPQPGFQPAQPAAYPPAPQQGYAGQQTGADPYPEKATAPPMPPPYSAN